MYIRQWMICIRLLQICKLGLIDREKQRGICYTLCLAHKGYNTWLIYFECKP